jgi:SAM-dependent methyltransferase
MNPTTQQPKTESKPADETIYRFERQEITLTPIPHPGRILDLGGGGEGTIGQLEGERVVAIAPMYPERFQAEAASGPLKILMDARELKFMEGTFPLVTSFFTLMYIPGEDHEKVFAEVFRVLQPGGRFYLWDVSVTKCLDETTEYYLLMLGVQLPECEIDTGYGQLWPGEVRDLAYYRSLAVRAGFEVHSASEDCRMLAMEMQKPAA